MERGPHGERCLHLETFLTHLPQSPTKEPSPRPPPQSLFRERYSIPRAPFIQLSKSLVDEPSFMFPKRPLWKEIPVSRAFFTYPSGSPARELKHSCNGKTVYSGLGQLLEEHVK
jgi:hypothetical protein